MVYGLPCSSNCDYWMCYGKKNIILFITNQSVFSSVKLLPAPSSTFSFSPRMDYLTWVLYDTRALSANDSHQVDRWCDLKLNKDKIIVQKMKNKVKTRSGFFRQQCPASLFTSAPCTYLSCSVVGLSVDSGRQHVRCSQWKELSFLLFIDEGISFPLYIKKILQVFLGVVFSLPLRR